LWSSHSKLPPRKLPSQVQVAQALAFKNHRRKPSTRTLFRDTLRLLYPCRLLEDQTTDLPHRKKLQQPSSLRWSKLGQAMKTSAGAVFGGRICLTCRMLVWYVPCSTKTLSSISIAKHFLEGSTFHKNLSTLLCCRKRYTVAISNRSSFERSIGLEVTIWAG
jgi:hypothetical protein